MIPLPPKTPTEAKVVTFDFSNEAAPGATLTSPVVTKVLLKGSDIGATALTLGTPTIPASTQTVLVLVSAGADGNTYAVRCEVTASNLEVHDIAASIPVFASAA